MLSVRATRSGALPVAPPAPPCGHCRGCAAPPPADFGFGPAVRAGIAELLGRARLQGLLSQSRPAHWPHGHVILATGAGCVPRESGARPVGRQVVDALTWHRNECALDDLGRRPAVAGATLVSDTARELGDRLGLIALVRSDEATGAERVVLTGGWAPGAVSFPAAAVAARMLTEAGGAADLGELLDVGQAATDVAEDGPWWQAWQRLG